MLLKIPQPYNGLQLRHLVMRLWWIFEKFAKKMGKIVIK